MARVIRHLLSDNASGAHPDALAMIADSNSGHAVAYGHDPVTKEAEGLIRKHFGRDAASYFVATGTAANVVALKSATDSFHAVICAQSSHLHRDECGAPEKFLGAKLLVAPAEQGKLTPAAIAPLLRDTDMVHRSQPKVVSISQCTELGTVYTVDETRALSRFCHEHDLWLHVDGARLYNAAAALDVSLAELTTDAGVDLLSLGGTKNGLLSAEAAVVLNPSCGAHIEFFRKQSMHLLPKMRFVAAQFIALLRDDLWLRNARQANEMARRLAAKVAAIPGVEIVVPQRTNVVFAGLPSSWIPALQAHCQFHVWESQSSTVRWMTSFDTTETDIDDFVQRVYACC